AYTEIELHAAKRDLYSGEAPNPLHALALIIAGLKDAEGTITIPSLFDKVRQPTEIERDFWQNHVADKRLHLSILFPSKRTEICLFLPLTIGAVITTWDALACEHIARSRRRA